MNFFFSLPGIAGGHRNAEHGRRMKMEVEEKVSKLSITESKVIASCSYLDEKVQECSKRDRGSWEWT